MKYKSLEWISVRTKRMIHLWMGPPDKSIRNLSLTTTYLMISFDNQSTHSNSIDKQGNLFEDNPLLQIEQVEQFTEPAHVKTKVDEIWKFLQLFMQAYLSCEGLIKAQVDPAILANSEQPIRDKNYQVVVTYRDKKRRLENLKYSRDTKDPHVDVEGHRMYLKRDQLMICDDRFQKDVSIKLGKIDIPIVNFQFGQLNQVDNLEFEFLKYFDTAKLIEKFNNTAELKFTQTLYFYKEDYRSRDTYRKLEIVLTCWGKFYVMIEFQFEFLKMAFHETKPDSELLYLKLSAPPSFYVSQYNPRRSEQPKLKDDWIRVHNFILDQLSANQFIDTFQRLHLLNNTTVRIQLEKNTSGQMMKLTNRLSECQLMNNDVDVYYSKNNYLKQQSIITLKDITEKYKLPFSMKYNILAILSENKLSLTESDGGILNLCQFAAVEYHNSNQNSTTTEKVLEITVRSFMQQATNLNSFSDKTTSKKNFNLFTYLYSKNKEDFLDLEYIDNGKLTFIRSISITPSGFIYSIKEPEMTNKVLRRFASIQDSFIRVHFEDENMAMLKNMKFVCEVFFKKQLVRGVDIFERKYELLTWSASQLRGGSCWFIDPISSKCTRDQIINSLGTFRGIQPVAKYAARIGQQFSSSTRFQLPKQTNIKIDNDESQDRKALKYTDGIGKISKDIVEQIRKKHGEQICAIQIRFGGAKGVLVIDENLPNNTIELRKSMVKFDPPGGKYDEEIEILDINKFRGGYLNRQIIMLLMTLGVDGQHFMQLQAEYLKKLDDVSMIDASIYKYFNVDYNGEFQGLNSVTVLLQNMINAGVDPSKDIFIKGVLTRLRNRGYLILKTKANILVDKAARLIGIIDEHGVLEEDGIRTTYMRLEIYSTYSIDGKIKQNITGTETHDVVVTRNPCLHPGDVRKLKAVTDEEVIRRKGSNVFKNIVNCVVFPQKGQLAVTAQIAGGDLDGDLYFITWDDRLMFQKNYDPFKYDQVPAEKLKFRSRPQRVTEDYSVEEQIDFLVLRSCNKKLSYLSSEELGRIDNSHLAIAEKSPDLALDGRCLRLAELHSSAVDYVKTGEKVNVDKKLLAKDWPDYMEKQNKLQEFEGKTALGQMYRYVKEIIQKKKADQPSWHQGKEEKGLPIIKTTIIWGFQLLEGQMKTLGQLGIGEGGKPEPSDIPQINRSNLQMFINEHFQPHIEIVVRTIEFAFQKMRGLMNLYSIQDEFEIYSGSISSMIKGDGVHHKVSIGIIQQHQFNFENVQKQLIQHLVIFKDQVNTFLFGKITELSIKLKRVSLLHLILQYSPGSHPYDGKILGQFLYMLFEQTYTVMEQRKSTKQIISVFTTYNKWYRGLSWFFFSDHIIQLIKHEEAVSKQQLVHQDDSEQNNLVQHQNKQVENQNDLMEI